MEFAIQNFLREIELHENGVLTDTEIEVRFLWAVNESPHLVADYFRLLPGNIAARIRTLIDYDDLPWFHLLGTGLHADMEWFRNPPRTDIEARLASRDALREYLRST